MTSSNRCEAVGGCPYPQATTVKTAKGIYSVCEYHFTNTSWCGHTCGAKDAEVVDGYDVREAAARIIFEDLFRAAPGGERKNLKIRLKSPELSIKKMADKRKVSKSQVATEEQRFRKSKKYQEISRQWGRLSNVLSRITDNDEVDQYCDFSHGDEFEFSHQVTKRTSHAGGPDRRVLGHHKIDYD